MNKKILLLAPLALTICACNQTKQGKIQLSYGSRYDETATLITKSEVLDKVANEESFLLALMPGDEADITCSCWKTFSYYLDGYVKNHDQIVYKSNVYDLEDIGIKAPTNQDPGFSIFQNGKLVKQYFYSTKNTPTYFLNGDAFASFVDDISLAPKMIYINDEQYDELSQSSDNTAIAIVRKGCSDCGYVLPNVFDPFFKSQESKMNLYLLDIEDLGHYKKGMSDEENTVYYAYKDSIKISEKNNPDYGYSTGVVPTTFIFKNGEIIDGNVFFNDTISVNSDGQYYISQSYYSSSRVGKLKYTKTVLENKILEEDEIAIYNDYVYMPSNKAIKYHTPILEEFLNYYFK